MTSWPRSAPTSWRTGSSDPIVFWDTNKGTPEFQRFLIDGRNRLEAMERVGLGLDLVRGKERRKFIDGDPVAAIMSFNVHRRHLSPQTAPTRSSPGSQQSRRTINRAKLAQFPSSRAVAVSGTRSRRRRGDQCGVAQGAASQRAHHQARHRQGRGQDAEAEAEAASRRRSPRPDTTGRCLKVSAASSIEVARQFANSAAEERARRTAGDIETLARCSTALNEGKRQNGASALPQDGRSEDGSL